MGDIVDTIDDTYILARQAFPSVVGGFHRSREQSGDTEEEATQIYRIRWEWTALKILFCPGGAEKEGIFAVGLGLCDDNAAIIKEGDISVEGKENWFNLGMG